MQEQSRVGFMRILIVEDNPQREATLKAWLPSDVKPVVATSAGSAIGLLRRDSGFVYASVILDHDLQERSHSNLDGMLSGRDVVGAITKYLSRNVMILVHSVNEMGTAAMVRRLRNAGFAVDRISMDNLTEESLEAWVDEVRENWKDVISDEPV